ncbi:Ubiquitin-like superfamily protein [Hibiscus syriacus]|uniref:Ubiquitin-like superfamily protein n=1 Tax=Hibiscus syriacus TaxID=106335 RepID=A0A6A2XR02_HIBSY|nr:scarecrow-like protein 6 [Hibiscus syriacus]XP_039029377.1 scarecrow-like protein 6 [Hibiscus syriacus]KAE8678028.1 Ubiquitin-like superfamily protein [Hibiscus syriacus]
MHFQFQAKAAVELTGFASICQQEPTSVLHMRRSQSPPTSASTLSSSFNGGDTAPGGGGDCNLTETTTTTTMEFQPISSELDLVTGPGGAPRCNHGLEEWETMLPESAVLPSQDNSLLHWITGEVDDHNSFGLKQLLQSGGASPNQGLDFECKSGLGVVDQGPGFDSVGNLVNSDPGNLGCFSGSGILPNANNNGNGIQNSMFASPAESTGLNVSLPTLYQQQQQSQYLETQEAKPQILHPQNPNIFLPFSQENHTIQPLTKRLNHGNLELRSQIPKLPFSDCEFMRKQHLMEFPQQKPLMMAQQQQQEATLLDQLYKVAELVETGNFSHAQGILARLNHQLSPIGKPFQRAAFYFKEALQLLLMNNNPVSPQLPRGSTPFDVVFKMGAYKVLSEVSPLIQFINFTCNQALLEALDDADRIHIVDFDIGFGAQWASFMQELPMRSKGPPSLRITAFASPLTHHPMELSLMRENLMQFANEIGVSFELEVLNIDSLPMFGFNENEAFAVNFPVWSVSSQPSILPNVLRFVKQLRPKTVVSIDQGCDRYDLAFPQHIINAFHSYISLLESIDEASVSSDAVNKIERFLLVPRIENTILGRMHSLEKMPPWKTLFSSAGFTPISFSSFTETQAEYVVKRAQARGFHIEKRHTSLALCWQRRDLISALAWRC